MHRFRFVARAALLFAVALVPGAAGVHGQSQSGSGDSVAEAARKAREQKKNAPKPKHSLTDDDLAPRTSSAPTPSASAVSAAPTGASTTPAQSASSAEATENKEDPNSEAAWRKRFATARKRLADAQTELDVLTREAQKADLQYYSDPQKAMQEQYSRNEINQKNDKIAAKKKEIAALQQQLSDMEDDLRRAGGDPSWAR